MASSDNDKDNKYLHLTNSISNDRVYSNFDSFWYACVVDHNVFEYLPEDRFHFDKMYTDKFFCGSYTYLMLAAKHQPSALEYLLKLPNAIDYVKKQGDHGATVLGSAFHRFDDKSVKCFFESPLPTQCKLEHLRLRNDYDQTPLDIAVGHVNPMVDAIQLILDFILQNDTVENLNLYCSYVPNDKNIDCNKLIIECRRQKPPRAIQYILESDKCNNLMVPCDIKNFKEYNETFNENDETFKEEYETFNEEYETFNENDETFKEDHETFNENDETFKEDHETLFN